METFSALLAICAGNSPVSGEFPAQRPVTRSFDVFFDVRLIGSASLARSIRIRFHFRHRTGRIRSVSDLRAGRVWRSRHRPKTPNCLPGARDQVPALFRNAIERRGASVDPNSGAPITQSTFDMLRRMANPLSLLN